jgi:alanine racemase
MSLIDLSSTGLLTIDLGALQSNWLYLRDKVKRANGSARCAAVTKANAYGLGIKPVALSLLAVGCDEFFVATLNEGEELREILGSEPTIYVLGGIIHGFNQSEIGDRWVKFNLVPVLYDSEHVQRWLSFCDEQRRACACALKIDTGMNRLGLSAAELDELLNDIDTDKDKFTFLKPTLLMSHLACADDNENAFNQQQLTAFNSTAKKVASYFPHIRLSLSNSSGVFLDNQFHFDICRPGIALYGGNPVASHTGGQCNPMRQVVSLSLPVMQFKAIKKGESVGYGQTFTAKRDTQIVVVFGGYADGISRSLGNRGFAWCGDVSVPVIGRVSMDSICFDVTELDHRPSSVQLFRSKDCLDLLASAAGTIGYEILTSLGSRYQRQYINTRSDNEKLDLLSASYDK